MNEIHIPRWLAMAEGLPMVIEGEVLSETTKGIKIKGSALVKDSINCLRCGIELTNPVSRVVGIGPECCRHWGILRPDYEDAQALAEQLKSVTAFERWFPKAHVTIVGEYVVPKAALPVTYQQKCWQEEGKIRLRVDYQNKDIAKAIHDYKWNPDLKCWEYPATLDVLEDIRFYFPDVYMDASLHAGEDSVDPIVHTIPLVEIPPGPVEQEYKALGLYPFQDAGVKFMSKVKRCILADEMGLGKTVQAIFAIKDYEKVLIIVPNSLKRNWVKELKHWVPGSEQDIMVISGSPAKREAQFTVPAKFTIINYELVRLHEPELLAGGWDAVVLDEAQKIKNRKAQVTQALKKSVNCPTKILLTGTPIMNKPDDLWSLLNFLQPKVFRSYWRYANEYCIVTNNGWGYDVGGVNQTALPKLRVILSTMMLRRKKAEVWKDMPSKIIQKLWVGLDPKQEKLYEQLLHNMQTEYAGKKITTTIVLALITRLKQLCIDPALMTEKGADFDLSGPKVEALLELMDGTDEKMVIFSQYSQAIYALANRLTKEGKKYVILTGDVKEKERQQCVDAFQNDPDIMYFLCTTQAGGVGITLTAASIAVFFDKLWTPAANNQAQDRIHRIGQTKNCQIIELLAEGTVEEKIEALLETKAADFDSIIEGTSEFRHDQILDLLTLNKSVVG